MSASVFQILMTIAQVALGAAAAAGLILWARRLRLRGEIAIYALGLTIAAAIYVVFALVGGDLDAVLSELLGLAVFTVVSVLGLRRPAILALGWTVHAGWDALMLVEGVSYAPAWYGVVCLGFDLVLAGYLGWRWRRSPESRRL